MPIQFDFYELFSFAHWLYDTKPEPASQCVLRTTINRAYYSALISAREFTGASTQGQGGHKNVITALESINKYQEANKLRSLKLRRVEADYNTTTSFTARDVLICLQDARLVLFTVSSTPIQIKPYSQDFLDKSKFCVSQD